MRTTLLILITLISSMAHATERDSLSQQSGTQKPREAFIEKAVKVWDSLFDVDTAFIEPQHYHFQTLMQNSYSYEVYRLSDNYGNSIRFKPKASMKIGPYAGWSLIFLGWTIDVLHLDDGKKRKEFDVSLYSLPIGADFFYRQSGDDYIIQDIRFKSGTDASPLEGQPFNGIKSSVVGLNLYYVFNHRRFSYPAAFNQSTQQKVSCGSALAGIGYTRHLLEVEWAKLNQMTEKLIGKNIADEFTNDKIFEHVSYTDLSFSGGYGYNWVFAKNWLFASSLSLALSYKRSISESTHGLDAIGAGLNFRDFKFANLTIDGVGRFGIVWNNSRWFAGANIIGHAYNYSKSNFYTNNIFGSFNIYAGMNFGAKKKKK